MNADLRRWEMRSLETSASIRVHRRLVFSSATSATSAFQMSLCPRANNIKLNAAPFWRPTSAFRPGNHGPLEFGRRQNGRIMSPECGTPIAAAKCNRSPLNDLRSAARTARRQNSIIPERQWLLFEPIERRADNIVRVNQSDPRQSDPQRRARDSNSQPVARHHISSVAASHSLTLQQQSLTHYRSLCSVRFNAKWIDRFMGVRPTSSPSEVREVGIRRWCRADS